MHRYNNGVRTTEKLLLFRRHGKECEVHRVGLRESAKRYYMDCDCTIWVVGRTPQGHIVPRQSTGARTLEEAELQVKTIIAKSNAMALEDSSKVSGDTVHGPTIADCAAKYPASRKHELKRKTYQVSVDCGTGRVFCIENAFLQRSSGKLSPTASTVPN